MVSLFVALFFNLYVFAEQPGFSVSQSNNLVFVKTPWGSSIFIGPVGFDTFESYRFEIPLSEVRAYMKGDGDGGTSSSSPLSGDVSSLIFESNRLYSAGDFNRALQFVDEVLRRDPKHVRAWLMKGSLMHVMGQKDLARDSWRKASELDPGNEQIRNLLNGDRK